MAGPGLHAGVPPDAESCSCSPRSTGPILAPGSSQAPSKIRSAIGARASERDTSHVLEAEFASAPLESPQCGFESLVAVPEFRGDEDLVPGDSTLSHGGPYVSLVSIQFRRVNQTIAGFECGRDRLPCLLPSARLPHAEAEDGNLRAVVQRDAGFHREGHRGRDAARPT